jgi:hypothetical protein
MLWGTRIMVFSVSGRVDVQQQCIVGPHKVRKRGRAGIE